MLQFVKKWMREEREERTIVEDGTRDKWTKCEDGLPCSDRQVEILVYGIGSVLGDYNYKPNIALGKFNPHVGWNFEGHRGVVLAWRDLDKAMLDIISDYDFIKKVGKS